MTLEDCLEPRKDGLYMRPSGPWVAEKLFYLERYLRMFNVSMHGKPWRAINYIDLFAGPGKCYVEESGQVYLGSPLLALRMPHPFTHYFFVDQDTRRVEALKKRISASPFASRVHCFVGDSNDVVREIVERIRRADARYISGAWPSLNLAFLDPDGLELRWETVVTLAEVRTDLIIHYSEMGIARNAPICVEREEETVVDRFFGSREWRDIYRASSRTAPLLEHYMHRLQELGYQEVKRDDHLWNAPLIRSAEKRAPLYRLLFASKSPLGHKFWREVTSKDPYGQRRLLDRLRYTNICANIDLETFLPVLPGGDR